MDLNSKRFSALIRTSSQGFCCLSCDYNLSTLLYKAQNKFFHFSEHSDFISRFYACLFPFMWYDSLYFELYNL